MLAGFIILCSGFWFGQLVTNIEDTPDYINSFYKEHPGLISKHDCLPVETASEEEWKGLERSSVRKFMSIIMDEEKIPSDDNKMSEKEYEQFDTAVELKATTTTNCYELIPIAPHTWKLIKWCK